VLVLDDPGGEPLDRLIRGPMELGPFLRLAVSAARALRELHTRHLIHKDIKPENLLVDVGTGHVRLMGFGIASRLQRERQAPAPPETIAGSLAYMAPEQTGRMNRSVDARSDLYSLGVTLYQMLTGCLPFTAADPLEWVHCHIARQPVPPAERLESVPAPVSAIVMKLLAKTAEERYQTAAGLEHDLRRCLARWEAEGRIGDFPLGEHDTPDRLLIPEKLYGRSREIEALLVAFERMVNGGPPELVLVSGYSGVGKSSVVNELHKVRVPPRGLFASGKFDQYKRDIPYDTLSQALRSLILPLLGKSEAELARWRDRRRAAAGSRAFAPGRAAPLPAGRSALPRRVRQAGASTGALSRRPAMARRGYFGSHRRPADSIGSAAPVADRSLSRQRARCLSSAQAQTRCDPSCGSAGARDHACAARP
jgi:serine/threonine protein kinase